MSESKKELFAQIFEESTVLCDPPFFQEEIQQHQFEHFLQNDTYELHDLEVQVGDRKLFCHQLVLKMCSPMIKKMIEGRHQELEFNFNWDLLKLVKQKRMKGECKRMEREQRQEVIEYISKDLKVERAEDFQQSSCRLTKRKIFKINNIKSSIVLLFLKYCYNQDFDFATSNVDQLTLLSEFAQQVQCSHILPKISKTLIHKVCLGNAYKLYLYSVKYDQLALRKQVTKNICKSFQGSLFQGVFQHNLIQIPGDLIINFINQTKKSYIQNCKRTELMTCFVYKKWNPSHIFELGRELGDLLQEEQGYKTDEVLKELLKGEDLRRLKKIQLLYLYERQMIGSEEFNKVMNQKIFRKKQFSLKCNCQLKQVTNVNSFLEEEHLSFEGSNETKKLSDSFTGEISKKQPIKVSTYSKSFSTPQKVSTMHLYNTSDFSLECLIQASDDQWDWVDITRFKLTKAEYQVSWKDPRFFMHWRVNLISRSKKSLEVGHIRFFVRLNDYQSQ